MKILYVDPMSRNNLGIYDKNLLKNIEPCMIYFFCNKDFQFDKIGEVNIIKEYEYNRKKHIFKIFSYVKSQYNLYKFAKENKISIIHFQWLKIPVLDFLLIKLLQGKGIKIVLTAHNLLPHDSGEKYFKIYKKIYKTLDRIIVHAQNTKLELEKIFFLDAQKINVIPHGLLELLNKSTSKNFSLRNCDKEIIFSLVGALNSYKGVDILIEAWSKIEESDKIKLVIAGAGKINFSKIEKMKNVVIINRFLTDEELNEILEETDVAILPYRKISQSGVLLTALNKKIPVIVSNIGGLVQPFELGNVGWIVDNINEKNLCDVINKVIKNKNKINEIKNNRVLWTSIEEYYSWEKIGKKTYKLYIDILS